MERKYQNTAILWIFLISILSIGIMEIIMPQAVGKAYRGFDQIVSPTAKKSFTLQAGTPSYLKNFANPAAGCRWMGVSGQIFGQDGKPITGLTVKLGGTLNGKAISGSSRSGSAYLYGEGGYEIVIADAPSASRNSLWIEVYQSDGSRVSERVTFDTYNDCERNLVIINFKEGKSQSTPTATKTLTATKSSPTITKTRTATITMTPKASLTSTRTPTPKPTLTATKTIVPSPTLTKEGYIPFYEMAKGSPLYIRNLFHPSLNCQWMGVGGQVFDAQGKPVRNVIVEVNGRLNNKPFVGLSMTGNALAYGAGGFEVFLSPKPIDTKDNFWIVLRDLNGRPLSYHINFDTYADCKKNLILFHFIETSK